MGDVRRVVKCCGSEREGLSNNWESCFLKRMLVQVRSKYPLKKVVKFHLLWHYFKFHLKGRKNALFGFNYIVVEANGFNSKFCLIHCICYLNKNLNLLF